MHLPYDPFNAESLDLVHENYAHALVARVVPTFAGRLRTPYPDLNRAPRIDRAGLYSSTKWGPVHEPAAGKAVPGVSVCVDVDEPERIECA